VKTLECTIFNVEHGFCSFIKSPNDYGLLIDCGSREYFSPVKWVRGNYNIGKNNIQYFHRRRIATLIISHLHMDHFDDIGSLVGDEEPARLLRDKKTLPTIDTKIEKEKDERNKTILTKFKKFQAKYTEDPEDDIDWGFEFHQRSQISYKDAEDVSAATDNLINNRSYIVAIQFAGKKILFPGDMELKGWEKAFGYETVKKVLKNTNFFVASHHGHKSGFATEILDHTGIPDLYIVSARSGDEAIDTSYSKLELSNGYLVDGDKDLSRMISTRDRDNSIRITIDESGKTSISIVDTPDNLDEHQKKILARRTRRVLKSWGY